LCKWTGWIEVFWAGMIHPNVLKEWGINPNEYRWFAFWLGITRIVAIKYQIKDIRLFNSWDMRFLEN
jgi:phenylalanyl-tRNA synthetase alpha chain